MYLCNMIIQITVLDMIMKGGFVGYGLDRDFEKIFPKTVQCTIVSLDHSYSVKATCLLPLGCIHQHSLTHKIQINAKFH